MFCTNCGKEVEDTWKKCPYCGGPLTAEEKKSEDDAREVFKEEPHKGKTEKDQYSIIRIVLKASAIIAFVCFFCPLYMVSCAGQELLSVSGFDLMTGIEYMGEQMEGNIAYGLLGLFPFLGVISAFRLRKKLVILKDYEKMKSIFYEISISGGTAALTIFFFTRVLEEAFAETGLTIDTCTALTIMILGSIILFAVSGYQAYKLEKRRKNNILKCLGSIAGGVLVDFIIVMVILYMSGAMDSAAASQDYASESTQISDGQENADQFNADEVFNDFEKKNVELIKKVEDEVNGVNQAGSFIGMDGWYTCITGSEGITGHINVQANGDGTVNLTFRILEMSYDILSVQGVIIDDTTIQADYYGYIITMTWTDAENMTITKQGELSGTDSGIIMDITDNQSYLRTAEFNQW